LSKKFTSGFGPPENEHPPFSQKLWPTLPPKAYGAPAVFKKEMEGRVVKEAKEKALIIEKEAYEKGFAQGQRDGLDLGKKRIEVIVHQLQNLFTAIEGQKENLFRTYEKDMVHLVLSIAKKVLHRELELQEDAILGTLRDALGCVANQRKVIARVNPTDYQYLSSHLEELPFSVKMVEDPSITRGGCLLETPFGDTDATVEGQFDEIASVIWERFDLSKNSTAL
jgi:flagellar assembly protein FliH